MNGAQIVDFDEYKQTNADQIALQVIDEQVDDLTAMNDTLRQNEVLTAEVALESVRVLGTNVVLEAHYSALTQPQKVNVAVESLREKLKDAIKKFFQVLKGLIKKALEWIIKVTAKDGSAPKEKKVKTAKEVLQKTAQEVKSSGKVAREKPKANEKGEDRVTKFLNTLTDTEYSILAGADFNDKLNDLRRELAHDHRAFEFEAAITSMTKWVAHASGIVNDFVDDHKNDDDEFPHKAYDALSEKLYAEAADLMKQHTKPLEKITDYLHEFEDERDKWQRSDSKITGADDLATLLDLVVSNTNKYAQFTKDGIWLTWKSELEKADRDVDAAIIALTALIEKNEDEGQHYAYNLVMQIQRNVLRYLPTWVVEMSRALSAVATQSEAAVTLTVKTLGHVAATAKDRKRMGEDPEMMDLLINHANQSIQRIEEAGK
jgi:hypothetical protein